MPRSEKEIAKILGLSHFTVRNRVMDLLLFGVSRRGDLVRAAEMLGFTVEGEVRRGQPPTAHIVHATSP